MNGARLRLDAWKKRGGMFMSLRAPFFFTLQQTSEQEWEAEGKLSVWLARDAAATSLRSRTSCSTAANLERLLLAEAAP